MDYQDAQRFAEVLNSLASLETPGLHYTNYQALHLKPLDALESRDTLRELPLKSSGLVGRDAEQLSRLDQIEVLSIGRFADLPGFGYFGEMSSLKQVRSLRVRIRCSMRWRSIIRGASP